MLREDPGEPVGLFDPFFLLDGKLILAFFEHLLRGLDFFPQTQLMGDFSADGHVVAGYHLYFDAVLLCFGNGLGGILPGRVIKGQEAQELPILICVGPGHSQGAVALASQLIHRFIGFFPGSLVQIAKIYDDLGSTLADLKGFPLTILHRGFGPFVHWIEGHKSCLLIVSKLPLVLHPAEDCLVDGIRIHSLGGQGPGKNQFLGAIGPESHRVPQGELVLGQSPCFVRTEDVDTGHLFNGLQAGDNGFFPGQGQGSQSHGHG